MGVLIMARYAYELLTDRSPINIRFVAKDYILKPNERDGYGDALPKFPLTATELAEITANIKKSAKQAADIEANLPSWGIVKTAIEGLSSLAEAKVILVKLARVVYWLAKNAEV